MRSFLSILILAMALLAGCGKRDADETPAADSAPQVAKADADSEEESTAEGDTSDEESSESEEEDENTPASERERTRKPSEFHDEGALANAGFLTSKSGLAAELLEAAFVDASCETGGDLTRQFLQAGYSPDSENSAGLTPLHCAALRGEMQNVRALLELGAQADATTWEQHLTPLHYAALGHHTEIAAELVNAGADVDADSKLGVPMMIALRETDEARRKRSFDSETGIPADFAAWVKMGASVDGTDDAGNTLLHIAAERSNQAWVEDLIEREVPVDERNAAGATPLEVAMDHLVIDGNREPNFTRQLPLVRALIEAGADVNVRDVRGVPLVVRTAQSPDLMPLFVEAGADFNALGKYCESFWKQLMSYAWGYMPEKVYVDVFAKSDAVKKIDAAPTIDGKRCDNPLIIAARTGEPRLVEYFLDRDIDANSRGEYGYTPLFVLASSVPFDRRPQEPALRALDLLLDADADINFRDDRGRTVLQAAERRSEAFRAKLARAGAR